jgi:hypothetical protein
MTKRNHSLKNHLYNYALILKLTKLQSENDGLHHSQHNGSKRALAMKRTWPSRVGSDHATSMHELSILMEQSLKASRHQFESTLLKDHNRL